MEAIAANILLEGLAVNALAQCETPVTLVTTDSREVCPGCIFVAFPGEKFDGHDFAAKALENGALCVVLNHPVEGVPEEKSVICPDSYHAMMVLGANYRSQFHPKVVGVTGSVGKTTTKQMTYAAIAGFGSTIKTEGNQNNELGLPRTMFRIGKETQYAVVEMGMQGLGEIRKLSCGDGTDHFDYDTSPHYHYVCRQCGRVMDIPMEATKELETAAKEFVLGTIDDHTVFFYGICDECLKGEKH